MDFSEKIVMELNTRGWSRSEAARRGGISPSMFDKVINGYAEPGFKFLKGIAQAFELPLGEVISWLNGPSMKDSLTPKKRELMRLAEQADDETVELAIAMLEAAWERKKRQAPSNGKRKDVK